MRTIDQTPKQNVPVQKQYNLSGMVVLIGVLIFLLGSQSALAGEVNFPDSAASTLSKLISLGLESFALVILGFGWKSVSALRFSMAIGAIYVMFAYWLAIDDVSTVMRFCSDDAKSLFKMNMEDMAFPILLGIFIIVLALVRLSIVRKSERG